jgi:hypothetical protein
MEPHQEKDVTGAVASIAADMNQGAVVNHYN